MSVPRFDVTSICRRCLGLYDRKSVDGLRQRCECRPAAPAWPRFDFNQRIELCRCCLGRVLGSGSKYSVWFCQPCKRLVVGFNDEMCRWLIPTGRHSFMVRTYSRGGRVGILALPMQAAVGSDSDGEREVQAFAEALWAMKTSQERLEAWSKGTLERLLDDLGFPMGTDVNLCLFLWRLRSTSRRDPAFGRQALFGALTRYALERR